MSHENKPYGHPSLYSKSVQNSDQNVFLEETKCEPFFPLNMKNSKPFNLFPRHFTFKETNFMFATFNKLLLIITKSQTPTHRPCQKYHQNTKKGVVRDTSPI